MSSGRITMTGAFRCGGYERQVLVVHIVAIFMTVFDSTMVNVALPTMADHFGVRASDVDWIAVGYLLAVASVIPGVGWLGDRFGTLRILLAWRIRDEDAAETRGVVPAATSRS